MSMLKNKIRVDNLIDVVCYITNFLFMLIHILYLVIALASKIYVIAYINVFSAIFYLLLFILIKKSKFEIYALLCGIEISIYMTTATILTGYNPGYLLIFFGLCTLAFVTKYFLKDKKVVVNPIIVSAIFMVDYLFLYFFTKYNPPIYIYPDYINTILYISHAIIVFIFCVGFLAILIQYVFRLEKQITKESETDRLTQLPNRKALSSFFEVLGNQKSNYLLAMFDIDNFKQLNDINGHICGDYILKEIANIAKNNSLDDFVCRWGGEEFVVISKIEEDLEKTYEKIDMIRQKIAEYVFKYNNKALNATITIGVATYDEGITLDEWISKADKLLYSGKNNGKNKTVH